MYGPLGEAVAELAGVGGVAPGWQVDAALMRSGAGAWPGPEAPEVVVSRTECSRGWTGSQGGELKDA